MRNAALLREWRRFGVSEAPLAAPLSRLFESRSWPHPVPADSKLVLYRPRHAADDGLAHELPRTAALPQCPGAKHHAPEVANGEV